MDRDYKALFTTLWENSVTGLALVAPDGRWISVNPALCRFLGYSESELQKLTYQDITHPQDVDDDVEMAGRISSGDIPWYEMDKRYITKYGRVVWCGIRVTAHRDREGKFLGYVSQVSPIDPSAYETRNEERRASFRWSTLVKDWKFLGATIGGAAYLIAEAWKNWRNH